MNGGGAVSPPTMGKSPQIWKWLSMWSGASVRSGIFISRLEGRVMWIRCRRLLVLDFCYLSYIEIGAIYLLFRRQNSRQCFHAYYENKSV
jgi:hypothetical protein